MTVTAADGLVWVGTLPSVLHRQARLLTALITTVADDSRWVGLELGCSLAEGRADEWSDVDVGLWHGDQEPPSRAEVTALVRGLGDVVEVSDRPWDGVPRWWVQYADGAQLDLVVGPVADRPGRAPGAVVLLDRMGQLSEAFTPSVLRSDREEQRGWLLDGWEALANVSKYLVRGSLLEAASQLDRARDRVFQLRAARADVRYPVFGLTSLLDDGAEPPEEIEQTYPAIERQDLLRAALVLADGLDRAAAAAEPPMSTPLASFIRSRLVALGVVDDWYAVRCVFLHGPLEDDVRTYEERITLWRAPSAEVAMERAENEAAEYLEGLGEVAHLGLLQSYWLADDPQDGAEVFSLMRDSRLAPDEYLTTFFDSGDERLQRVRAEGSQDDGRPIPLS